MVPMAAAPTVRPDYARLPVTVLLPDGRSVTVHFDRLTHSSKKPRALTECKLHRRCRFGRFLHMFSSERRCVAFMMAWHESGVQIEDEDAANDHRELEIDNSLVDEWVGRLEGVM